MSRSTSCRSCLLRFCSSNEWRESFVTAVRTTCTCLLHPWAAVQTEVLREGGEGRVPLSIKSGKTKHAAVCICSVGGISFICMVGCVGDSMPLPSTKRECWQAHLTPSVACEAAEPSPWGIASLSAFLAFSIRSPHALHSVALHRHLGLRTSRQGSVSCIENAGWRPASATARLRGAANGASWTRLHFRPVAIDSTRRGANGSLC